MSKELEALKEIEKRLYGDVPESFDVVDDDLYIIETALKEKEKQENTLKTISDIIRDFNNSEFANGKCVLEEITSILKGVLMYE